ncbi:MAG: PIN domain-containing protein [Actinomycetota bacterium]
MSTFVDTSALFAVLDRDDEHHEAAAACWRSLMEEEPPLLASNYVLLETVALVQRRLGKAAVAALRNDVFPTLAVFWVDETLHERAMAALVASRQREVSLVDWVSFEGMRERGLRRAFAFDRHFTEQGFQVIPASGR